MQIQQIVATSYAASHQRKVATVAKSFANSPIRQIANPANPTDSRNQAVAAAKISINFGKVAAAAEISAVSRRPRFRQCHGG